MTNPDQTIAKPATRLLALVTDAWGGPGGIAQYNRDLLAALSRQSVQIDILPRGARDAPNATPAEVSQHLPRGGRIPYTAAATALAVRLRPDVIFCGHLYLAPLAALLARLVCAKLIVQLHGVEIWKRPGAARRRALEAADFVFCVSRDTRARALAHADLLPECVLVVPNTVADQYAPGNRAYAREKVGHGEAFVLLSVGRLDSRERYKGHDLVLAAMPELIASGRKILYLIAGHGDDRSRLEGLVHELGVSRSVRFLGEVPGRDLPDLYRAADLFVLPSSGEGFGIVFLEAMACGVPALGLAVGGAQDALADGDLGVAAPAQEFFSELARLINAPKQNPAELAARVRKRFGRRTFETCVADAFERLVQPCANGGVQPTSKRSFQPNGAFL